MTDRPPIPIPGWTEAPCNNCGEPVFEDGPHTVSLDEHLPNGQLASAVVFCASCESADGRRL